METFINADEFEEKLRKSLSTDFQEFIKIQRDYYDFNTYRNIKNIVIDGIVKGTDIVIPNSFMNFNIFKIKDTTFKIHAIRTSQVIIFDETVYTTIRISFDKVEYNKMIELGDKVTCIYTPNVIYTVVGKRKMAKGFSSYYEYTVRKDDGTILTEIEEEYLKPINHD